MRYALAGLPDSRIRRLTLAAILSHGNLKGWERLEGKPPAGGRYCSDAIRRRFTLNILWKSSYLVSCESFRKTMSKAS
jgi:hypothetical protein